MENFDLNDFSDEEMRNELLHLRKENENLRNRISELEDELRERYEHIEIDKMPDADYLYEHRNDEVDDYDS